MGRTVKVGIIQVINSPEYDYRMRTERLLTLARGCFDDGAEIVFFPEAYQHEHDRSITSRLDELISLGEEWKERCSALAKEYERYLAPWDYRVRDGKVYSHKINDIFLP